MRLFIDTMVALTLVAVLGAIAMHSHNQRELDSNMRQAHDELRRFQSQVMLQAALEKVKLTPHGYPETIDMAWFGDDPPANPLLDAGHDLVDVAPESDADADHPRQCVAQGHDVPQFWYNPYKGLLRARVPGDVSESTALSMYNRVNDCDLASLPLH